MRDVIEHLDRVFKNDGDPDHIFQWRMEDDMRLNRKVRQRREAIGGADQPN